MRKEKWHGAAKKKEQKTPTATAVAIEMFGWNYNEVEGWLEYDNNMTRCRNKKVQNESVSRVDDYDIMT